MNNWIKGTKSSRKKRKTPAVILTEHEAAIIKNNLPKTRKRQGWSLAEEKVYDKIINKIKKPDIIRQCREDIEGKRLGVREAQVLTALSYSLMETSAEKKEINWKIVTEKMKQLYGLNSREEDVQYIYTKYLRSKLNLPKLKELKK